MMEFQTAQPILERGTRKSRKFGRYDFERFDYGSSLAGIGHATFDKVEVECKFLFKKSQWGVIGEYKNPAGIIYLDLIFRQPKDCQLRSATVIVTVDDEDKELQEMCYKLRPRRTLCCPVQMTDYYGPKRLTGPEKTVQITKSLHFTPSGEAMGFRFDGVGVDKESSFISSSRWGFRGQILSGKECWRYNTLKWDLSENNLDTESTHSSEVHTAFTFEHGGQPFFMRVEIKGRLRKLHGRVKDKLKLMKFPSNAEDGSVVTLINFGERISFKTPLDDKAQRLEFEMDMANLHAVPVEVTDSKPVPSQNDSTSLASTTVLARGEIETKGTDEEPSNGNEGQQETSKEQIFLWLLRIPVFVAFLRMLIGLLEFLGQRPSPTPSSGTQVDEMEETKRIHLHDEAVDESKSNRQRESQAVRTSNI